MISNDRIILDKILEQNKTEIAPDLSDGEYFELFTAEQILKDSDLSYDEIQSGIVRGGGDGGIDSIYLFINGELTQEDTNLSSFKRDISIELKIIQSKRETGFNEEAINKLKSTTEDLLNLSTNINQLSNTYNENLLNIIDRFRKAYDLLVTKNPVLKITYFYATRAHQIHPNIENKVSKLEAAVRQLFSNAQFIFKFITVTELLNLYRKSPISSFPINLTETPLITTGTENFVCLVNLKEFFKFITDPEGKLLRNIFEANVRDYQGETKVNNEIQTTLRSQLPEDFWWLNNGITIVASKANLSGGKRLTITDPQIVNGLQTSMEIYKYFKDTNPQDDNRNILLRVIVPDKSESRDIIIKATNSQTKIPDASLHATEKIHRDIEEYFKAHGLFYDRRKNFYKNMGKPIKKIVSIPYLAQAVMAIFLQKPDYARARPSSLLKRDSDYRKVFNPKYPIKLYLICAQLMRIVEIFIAPTITKLDAKDRNNLKFHLAMYLALRLLGKINPNPEELSNLSIDNIELDFLEILTEILNNILLIYADLGATDKVAKGPEFVKALRQRITNDIEGINK